jgi:hypothetical protein
MSTWSGLRTGCDMGDSSARASHGGASRPEVFTGARSMERLSASMVGSASDEASAWCRRRWWLCYRGAVVGLHRVGPWRRVV